MDDRNTPDLFGMFSTEETTDNVENELPPTQEENPEGGAQKEEGASTVTPDASGGAQDSGPGDDGVSGPEDQGLFGDMDMPSTPDTSGPMTRIKRSSRKAERMASQQREISVSEFFGKNRHLLGFDSPARALLTTVKEAVDNALDACEEADILPTIVVRLEKVGDDRFRVMVQDNGPGIVRAQIPKIFGQLLYGSKFHRLKQSRGQQGIGISAAGLHALLTTGKPVKITSRTAPDRPAHYFELMIDMKKNRPQVIKDLVVDWDEPHGTWVELEIKGAYKGGRHSVDEYLYQTSLANPHAEIIYINPKGELMRFPRVVDRNPAQPMEIRPHPHGVELGMLMKIIKESKSRKIAGMLQAEFSRVTPKVAREICEMAGVNPDKNPRRLKPDEIEAIHKAFSQVKIMAPPTSCVVPIGEDLIRKALEAQIPGAEIYVAKTRPPKVYKGNPFVVEVGLAYGGQLRGVVEHGEGLNIAGVDLEPDKTVDSSLLALPGMTRKKVAELMRQAGVKRRTRVKKLTDEQLDALRHAYDTMMNKEASSSPATVVRLANRVPLQYQQSACAISKAVVDTNWKRYGLQQPRGGLPQGPVVIMVHIASVWVPFTSESKEAIAHYPEILEEIKRALMDVGRVLGTHLKRKNDLKAAAEKHAVFSRYAAELARSLAKITGRDEKKLLRVLEEEAARYAGLMDDGEEEARNDEGGSSETDGAGSGSALTMEEWIPDNGEE